MLFTMLSTSGCVVSTLSSIIGWLRTVYTRVHGIERGEMGKPQWSIVFVFAYFCAGMGGASKRFSFVYLLMIIMDTKAQIERAACGIESPLPWAHSATLIRHMGYFALIALRLQLKKPDSERGHTVGTTIDQVTYWLRHFIILALRLALRGGVKK